MTSHKHANLLGQTTTIPGVTLPFVQNYTYDSLNRLESAEEKPSGWSNCTADPTKCWKQTFKYDRYGNRNFNTAGTNTTTLPANFDPKIFNPTIDTDDNRFEAGQGYSYDAAGNTTRDAESRKFTYDAENKQTKVETVDGSGNPIATVGEYFYDGDGKRVKKVVPGGETTVFVYDAGGKLIGEYSTVVQPVQDAKTVYTTNDHLGSPRINTDATGQVISRHDYHPFGEEIARTGYGSDTIRQQFTGYERDGETGLDFAQARYHNSSFGRFSSPDPLMASGRAYAPQTWNRYVYVLNNPMRFTDPSGMSEQGGTKIVHRERRPVIVTENLNVSISVEPSTTIPPKEYKDLETGETIVRNVFEVGVTLSDSNGQPLPGSAFTFQTVGLDENGKPYSTVATERQPDDSYTRTVSESYTAPGEPYTITANTDGSDNTTLNPETAEVQSDRHRSKITTNSGVATVDFATTRFNGNVSLDPAYDRSLPLGSSRIGYVAGDVPLGSRRRGGVQSILVGDALGINR